MANSTITLYTREIGIEAEKLQMIEDFENYLSSKATSLAIIESYQYQKIELTKYLKVDISQSFQSPLKDQNYVYCKIVNSDNTRPIYYWIKKMNWKSSSCIELDLVLDTLNTFKMGVDYTFSPKTIIQRQHKDRMKHFEGDSFEYEDYSIERIEEVETGTYYAMNKNRFTSGSILQNFGNVIYDSGYGFYYVYDTNTNKLMKWSEYQWGGTSDVKFNKIMTFFNPNDQLEHSYLMLDDVVSAQDIDPENLPSNIIPVILTYGVNINHDQDETLEFWEWIVGKVEVTHHTGNMRIIDLMSEELYPQLYGGDIKVIEDEESNKQSWYLVYNTQTEQNNVVDCYLVPEKPTSVNVASLGLSGGMITPDLLSEGYFYYIDLSTYSFTDFKDQDSSPLGVYENDFQFDVNTHRVLQLQKKHGVLIATTLYWGRKNYSDSFYIDGYMATPSVVCKYINYRGSATTINYGRSNTNYDRHIPNTDGQSSITTTGYSWSMDTLRLLGSISSLNRTLSTLLKVIKLPYIPYSFQYDSEGRPIIDSQFTFVNSWNGITNVLKLNDLSLDLRHILNTPSNDEIQSPIEEFMKFTTNMSLISNRNDKNESKMYHSEFFTPKFTYDSFSFIYKLELVDTDKWLVSTDYKEAYLSIRFVMTRTINSRFGFEFIDYIVNKKEDDYPNWLLVSRNNEEVIYNSSYLNYIRTGYNYDVKNKQAQATRNWVMVGASALTAVVGLVGSYFSGGASIPLAVMGVSGIISTSASITNAISTQAQNERSIQEKLDTLKIQTASVSGSDDVDLMTRYNGNRLLYLTYKVNERIDKLLKDLFYYYGYKDNVTGVPNTTTRIWFNYLKCEPILEFTSINMSQEIEDELKGIMRNGFTIIHKYNNTWDVEQVKENWEVSMLPYLS